MPTRQSGRSRGDIRSWPREVGAAAVMHRSGVLVGLASVLFGLACGESPTAPDRRIPPPVGTPTRLMLAPCEYGVRFASCSVRAIWGLGGYVSSRLVTAEAKWTSSAPQAVR